MVTEFGINLLPTSDLESRSVNHVGSMFIKWLKSELSNQIIDPGEPLFRDQGLEKQSITNKQT